MPIDFNSGHGGSRSYDCEDAIPRGPIPDYCPAVDYRASGPVRTP